MGTLVKHRGSSVEYAKQDPALALVSLFRPICRGKRPGGLAFESEYDGLRLKFNVWQALDVRDQSVLLAAVGLAGLLDNELKELHSGITHPRGQQLWLDLEPSEAAVMDRAIVLRTTRYALLQAAGMGDRAKDYGVLEDCLERLSMVGCRARKDGFDWSMRLLSYASSDDGTIHVALNPRFAEALAGQHVRVSLIERHALGGEVAQIMHAWLSAWIRPGRAGTIALDKLADKVWGSRSANASTLTTRRDRITRALKELGGLEGWSVTLSGRGAGAVAEVSRPKQLPRNQRQTTAQSETKPILKKSLKPRAGAGFGGFAFLRTSIY